MQIIVQTSTIKAAAAAFIACKISADVSPLLTYRNLAKINTCSNLFLILAYKADVHFHCFTAKG